MKENSNLKRIIDLYVEEGLDNTYLHDEMIKAFNNALPEERKEGHEYLNWKMQEEKKKGRDFSNEMPKIQYRWIFIFILIIIVFVVIIININNNDSDYTMLST